MNINKFSFKSELPYTIGSNLDFIYNGKTHKGKVVSCSLAGGNLYEITIEFPENDYLNLNNEKFGCSTRSIKNH